MCLLMLGPRVKDQLLSGNAILLEESKNWQKLAMFETIALTWDIITSAHILSAESIHMAKSHIHGVRK